MRWYEPMNGFGSAIVRVTGNGGTYGRVGSHHVMPAKSTVIIDFVASRHAAIGASDGPRPATCLTTPVAVASESTVPVAPCPATRKVFAGEYELSCFGAARPVPSVVKLMSPGTLITLDVTSG